MLLSHHFSMPTRITSYIMYSCWKNSNHIFNHFDTIPDHHRQTDRESSWNSIAHTMHRSHSKNDNNFKQNFQADIKLWKSCQIENLREGFLIKFTLYPRRRVPVPKLFTPTISMLHSFDLQPPNLETGLVRQKINFNSRPSSQALQNLDFSHLHSPHSSQLTLCYHIWHGVQTWSSTSRDHS